MHKFHSKVLAMISQNIYSLHTPVGGILYPLPSLSLPLSSLPLLAWRCSRWPCQSGPCVPAGIQLQSLKRPKVTKDADLLRLQPCNQPFTSPADFLKRHQHHCFFFKETRNCLTMALGSCKIQGSTHEKLNTDSNFTTLKLSKSNAPCTGWRVPGGGPC